MQRFGNHYCNRFQRYLSTFTPTVSPPSDPETALSTRRRQTDRDRDGQRETQRERENSKTLILEENSVKSIWTYLTASPCYTTNTNKHDYL